MRSLIPETIAVTIGIAIVVVNTTGDCDLDRTKPPGETGDCSHWRNGIVDPKPRPEDIARPVQVLRVPYNFPTVVRFLAPYRGLITHWPGRGQSLACPGVDECPSGTHRLRILWKGYAAAEAWEEESQLWWPTVVEITESLEETLRGHSLRGQVWILTRVRFRKKTEPLIGHLSAQLPPDSLRAAFGIEPVLCKFYGVAKLKLDVPNPVPGRLLLSASTDPAPEILRETVRETPFDGSEPMPKEELRARLKQLGFNLGGDDRRRPGNGTNGTIGPK